MKEAVIVAGLRTAVGRSGKGALRNVRPDDLAAIVIKELINRVPGFDPKEIDDIILGCSLPEAEQGYNIARVAALRAGIPASVPAFTVNRFCSSGLQSIAIGAEKIMCSFADVVVCGGVESMSHLPMHEVKILPNPGLMEDFPEAYMTMGLTAEEVASRFNISKKDQDAFAVGSHRKALAAISTGKFQGETVSVNVTENVLDANGKWKAKEWIFDTDEGARKDITLDGLEKLKPVFKLKGTVTAGNSSQTSDGAAAVMLMSAEKAQELGMKPLGVLRSYAVVGTDPDIMGIGPVFAIPKALKLAGISLEQVDLFELNEAFASQTLYCIRELGLDPAKVNVNGGAIAFGHPLGCTGAKLTVQLLNEMDRRMARYGVVSMCVGGGMGAAAVFERL